MDARSRPPGFGNWFPLALRFEGGLHHCRFTGFRKKGHAAYRAGGGRAPSTHEDRQAVGTGPGVGRRDFEALHARLPMKKNWGSQMRPWPPTSQKR